MDADARPERDAMSEPVITLRAGDLAWRAVEGDVVALDLRASRYLGTNATGALLWERLAEGATERQLVAALTERFPEAADRAAADVAAFLAVLRERGLVVAREDGAA
jgi:hypothetical protein